MNWATRITLAALAAATAGCEIGSQNAGGGSFRETIGLAAPPPDEFLVVSRAPLQIPPDLRALPTPQPGAPSRVEINPLAKAQAALAGAGASGSAPAPSRGEEGLLAAIGAAEADPAIREALAAQPVEGQRRFGLTTFLGRTIDQSPPGTPSERLDPREEAERLRREGLASPVPPPTPGAAPRPPAEPRPESAIP
jgi:hypothetical protein